MLSSLSVYRVCIQVYIGVHGIRVLVGQEYNGHVGKGYGALQGRMNSDMALWDLRFEIHKYTDSS